MTRRTIAAVVFCAYLTSHCAAQQPDTSVTPPASSATVQPLSEAAMDALVAPIAFYPDTVIEWVLDAAQYPDAVKQAAHTGATTPDASWPQSVQALTQYRDVLKQMDDNPVVTARLALAARTQLADVWAAVDRVRAAFEQQSQQSAAATGTGATAVATPYGYPTAAFVAGYWTAQVADEMVAWYQASSGTVVYGQAATTVVGPAGNSATLQAAGAAGQVAVGDTTYFGAAGAGSVTTSTGTVVQGQGAVAGQATQTATGGSYQTQAAGSLSSNTGQYGAGQHQAEGSYTVNPDGSVSFQRDAQTQTLSSSGSSAVQHSGSGTVTGQGTGDYSGSTSIQSTHGDISVSTTASDGQLSSTLSTDQTQKSVTLGDSRTSTATPPSARVNLPQSMRAPRVECGAHEPIWTSVIAAVAHRIDFCRWVVAPSQSVPEPAEYALVQATSYRRELEQPHPGDQQSALHVQPAEHTGGNVAPEHPEPEWWLAGTVVDS